MWITAQSVINFTGVKPIHFKLDKDDDTGLQNTITEWVLQGQSLIINYTRNNWEDSTVPAAVQNVLLRLVANMVAVSIARRDTPITQVNDWSISIISSEIFTNDLKGDLEPFVKASVTGKSDHVTVYTVTGKEG